jgi:hypothetical protein
MVPVDRLAGPANAAARRLRKSLSNRRLEFQLCAWSVGPRGFVLVLSTARAMERGLSPFGHANYENVLPAAHTIHHACPAVAMAK